MTAATSLSRGLKLFCAKALCVNPLRKKHKSPCPAPVLCSEDSDTVKYFRAATENVTEINTVPCFYALPQFVRTAQKAPYGRNI